MSSESTPKQQTEMQCATKEDCEKIKCMIKDNPFAMMTTVDESGDLHSRPMGAQGELECAADGSCIINFFTDCKSHKVDELKKHDWKMNLAFGDPKSHKWLSISGLGTCTQDRAEMEKYWSPVLKAWFPKGLDEPGCSLLKVKILKAEYWDTPSSLISHAISFVSSQLSGKPYVPAGHKAVTMEGGVSGAGKAQEHKEQGATQKAAEMKD